MSCVGLEEPSTSWAKEEKIGAGSFDFSLHAPYRDVVVAS